MLFVNCVNHSIEKKTKQCVCYVMTESGYLYMLFVKCVNHLIEKNSVFVTF